MLASRDWLLGNLPAVRSTQVPRTYTVSLAVHDGWAIGGGPPSCCVFGRTRVRRLARCPAHDGRAVLPVNVFGPHRVGLVVLGGSFRRAHVRRLMRGAPSIGLVRSRQSGPASRPQRRLMREARLSVPFSPCRATLGCFIGPTRVCVGGAHGARPTTRAI